MPVESLPDPPHTPDPVHPPPASTPSAPRPWTRADRNHLIIFIVVGILIPSLISIALGRVLGRASNVFTLGSELATRMVMAFFALFATWLVARLSRHSLDDFGIPPGQSFGRRFWEGALWGFLLLTLVLFVLRALGCFRFDSFALTGASAVRLALGWAVVFLGVSVSEELSFRGYWLFAVARRLSFWRAALILSLAFAGAHFANRGETAIGIAHVFTVGLFLCLSIRRTGNLWFALGFHAAWDWAESFFYGVPDSGFLTQGRFLDTSSHGPDWLTGGSAGPEGSLVALLLLLLAAFLIHLRFPKATYPDYPA